MRRDLSVRVGAPYELTELLERQNQEFIFGRGRAVGFESRFPDLFSRDRPHFAMELRDSADELLAGLTVKRGLIRTQDYGTLSAAMIGGVWVTPARRGMGLGSELMGRLHSELLHKQTSIAVLWSRKHEFYSRNGWTLADEGVSGVLTNATPGTAEELDHANSQNERNENCGWIRCPLDSTNIPIPADTAGRMRSKRDSNSYWLVSTVANQGFAHEFQGDLNHAAPLLSTFAESCARLTINTHLNRPEFPVIREHLRDVTWSRQDLTHWWRSPQLSHIPDRYLALLPISFLDRF